MANPTLYHYVHCPFCLRVRFVAGFLDVVYNSQVLNYDDEKTPVDLMGKKMLPIWQEPDGKTMNESLDIIRHLDKENKLLTERFLSSENWKELDGFLNNIGSIIHSITMPHWIYTKEFNESSRQYFQKKKEVKRGPFKDLVHKRPLLEQELEPMLEEIESILDPYYNSGFMTVFDVLVASHLWGLYVVPEFQFSKKMHDYLQAIKRQCILIIMKIFGAKC